MSRMAGGSYPIGRSQRTCYATQRALAPGEKYVAALVETEGGGVERRDYSVQAWEAGPRPVKQSRLIGFWRGTVGPAENGRRAMLDDETMLDLFDQTPPDRAERAALRFVLALMMVRRRVMLQEGARDGAMLLRRAGEARPPEGPAFIEVRDPGLDEGTIAEVIAELEGMSSGTAAERSA